MKYKLFLGFKLGGIFRGGENILEGF